MCFTRVSTCPCTCVPGCVCVCPHGLTHEAVLRPALPLWSLKVLGILSEQKKTSGSEKALNGCYCHHSPLDSADYCVHASLWSKQSLLLSEDGNSSHWYFQHLWYCRSKLKWSAKWYYFRKLTTSKWITACKATYFQNYKCKGAVITILNNIMVQSFAFASCISEQTALYLYMLNWILLYLSLILWAVKDNIIWQFCLCSRSSSGQIHSLLNRFLLTKNIRRQ